MTFTYGINAVLNLAFDLLVELRVIFCLLCDQHQIISLFNIYVSSFSLILHICRRRLIIKQYICFFNLDVDFFYVAINLLHFTLIYHIMGLNVFTLLFLIGNPFSTIAHSWRSMHITTILSSTLRNIGRIHLIIEPFLKPTKHTTATSLFAFLLFFWLSVVIIVSWWTLHFCQLFDANNENI